MRYTRSHEWVASEDGVATVGITRHAQNALGDIVFVELPVPGRVLAQGAVAGVIESVKAASDLFAPLTGEVIAVNQALTADPSLGNKDPLGSGWFFRLKIHKPAELEALLDEPAYEALVAKL
jgi:glycine cleavage system H protein